MSFAILPKQGGCVAGKGRTYIPLAINEHLGDYEVRATDVLTGTTASVNVTVLPKPSI